MLNFTRVHISACVRYGFLCCFFAVWDFCFSRFFPVFCHYHTLSVCLCLYIHTHVHKHLSAFRHRQMYTHPNFQLLQVSYILIEGADMLQSMCSFPSLSPCLKYYCFCSLFIVLRYVKHLNSCYFNTS